MLELKNIVKTYRIGENIQNALNDVSLTFTNNQFVSILGESGSGKTTLLNIIGGLDEYTSGDLIVEDTSTKNFKDRDWDSYRNGTIGFVFQSYNLISHLSVIENVKLALSISGISSKESYKRSFDALKEIGLEKHINKKPNQLSGGQMQRVAIARALVTNPKIILADEPTGALDSKTSIQIMELIKKISKDKVVIMVTHNPALAEKYSDRIVKFSDGKIIEDSEQISSLETGTYKYTKTSMSFVQAISSSFKNLWTKKTRTILTTIAASIGIISVGTVLSISNGMNGYIDSMQKDTLSTMPISVNSQGPDVNARANFSTQNQEEFDGTIKVNKNTEIHNNDYTTKYVDNMSFLDYMDANAKDFISAKIVSTGYNLKAFVKDSNGKIVDIQSEKSSSPFANSNFGLLPSDSKLILDGYELVESKDSDFTYPTGNQAVLFLDSNGNLRDSELKMLGLSDVKEINTKEIIGKTFSILSNDQYFTEVNGRFFPSEITQDLYDSAEKLEIVAIFKPKDEFASSFNSTIGYTSEFLNKIIEIENKSKVIISQNNSPTNSIIGLENSELTTDDFNSLMQSLGGSNLPNSIDYYANSFENREALINVINEYNSKLEEKFGLDTEEYTKAKIVFTDLSKLITNTFTTILSAITFILTAFSAISLLVSSVMIGILTYVSVVERTKEIGILRAMGARKKDISRIFNAEAGILGFSSGLIGVFVALSLTLPINNLVKNLINVDTFNATLSVPTILTLIGLSVGLTLIAGYIPSKIAARKNPVEALRTE